MTSKTNYSTEMWDRAVRMVLEHEGEYPPHGGRRWCEADLKIDNRRIFEENFEVCGARKVWRERRREGQYAAR